MSRPRVEPPTSRIIVRAPAAIRRDRRVGALAAGLATVAVTAALVAGPDAQAGQNAQAAPAAPAAGVRSEAGVAPAYPAASSATRYAGPGFDTCTAPSRTAMRAWKASTYRAVGIYTSGGNRACAQPQLTASWVADVSAMGWKLLPINMGLQAPCRDNTRKAPMDPRRAAAQGKAEAATAAKAAGTLGILPGSPIYADIESYDPARARCARAVADYMTAWTRELHARGYLSGMYGNIGSALADASDRYARAAHARPDAVWLARWDRSTRLTGWAGIPDTHWPAGQRVKQYRGDHAETHGKVRMLIDSDHLDAPVATVARSYRVTAAGTLNTRRAPSASSEAAGARAAGSLVAVVCQTSGGGAGDAAVWDKLTDGTYVADAYVAGGARKKVPACTYPAQVVRAAGALARTGPGAGRPAAGTLPLGALAWATCRAAEAPAWVRLADGRFAAAADLAVGASAALPRC